MQTPVAVNPVLSSQQGYAWAEERIFTCSAAYTSLPEHPLPANFQKQDAGLGGRYVNFLT